MKELDGVEVGMYEDFGKFRDYIVTELEAGVPGARFPVLVLTSSSDGEWTPDQCRLLRQELTDIAAELEKRPAVPLGEWQAGVAASIGLTPSNAYQSFIDVDGELLIDRLASLADLAIQRDLPIVFQ